MDVQRVSDELEITALLSRYARDVDTKDWAVRQLPARRLGRTVLSAPMLPWFALLVRFALWWLPRGDDDVLLALSEDRARRQIFDEASEARA